MNNFLRTLLVPALLLSAAGAIALFAMNRESVRASTASATDKALPPYQTQLVELAFKAASALPEVPHSKNRCRLQGDVVEACLALDLPQRALACTEKISDWRRGLGYAEYASYCAQHGATEGVEHALDLAQKISEQGEPVLTQDWQKDRIKVGIAKTHAWLGHAAQAASFENGLEHSEMGKVDAVRALQGDAKDFDSQRAALEKTLAAGDFDLSHNALETCAQLFNRYYADSERRDWAENAIKNSWSKLPLQVRIEALIELTGFALAHQDSHKALALVDDAQEILDSEAWLPEGYIPFEAQLGALRWRAGAKEDGRKQVEAALARFDKDRTVIVDIYRAGALRPIAESYAAIGERALAIAVYKRAVEEGLGNPNSRPRAEDLVATCLSLAKGAVEPDEELGGRLEKVCKGLKEPW
ncbi:MAG: hypothetical protein IPJ19_15595 [Planctomycetes bacterium]|nr:hypothetical protein [Planctomycetota bacterium]